MTSLPTTADIPPSLLDHDQWVCWREETRGKKQAKIPVNPATGRYASTNKPNTWTSFDEARSYATDGSVDGLGFVFTADDTIVGVDLDNARDPDDTVPTEWAATIIHQLDSYTEISPSGTGYHVLVEGTLPLGRNRRGDVELYETGRFFTVTADHVDGTPTAIHERTEELTTVYKAHVANEALYLDDTTSKGEQAAATDDVDHTVDTVTVESTPGLSDDEVIDRARAAANSAKFERLWRGDTAGYDSHSEADMALCCLLAFWTGGETSQMVRLFRRSGLHREKWDTVHYGDGRTYGETTIERAVSVTSDVYEPPAEHDKPDRESNDDSSERGASTSDSAAIAPTADRTTATPHARERERIETITELEQQLRTLEQENETLRDELMSIRAADRSNETAEPSARPLNRIRQHLLAVFARLR